MGCTTSKASALPIESVESLDAVTGDDHYSTITSSMHVKSGIANDTGYAPVNVSPTASIATTVSLRSPCASMTPWKSTTAFADAYTLEDPLGNGAFGSVYSASQNALGRKRRNAPRALSVAVKVVHDTKAKTHESEVWSRVGSHKHCIVLYETFVEHSVTYMVMEKAERSLVDELVARKLTSEKSAGNIFGQMLLGIAHCHRQNVIHRDIKPENFLVTGNGEGCIIKLADFGLGVMYTGDRLDGIYGSAPYLAPEVVRKEGVDTASDVWSLGATAYKLLYGEWVYMARTRDSSSMKEMIRIGMPMPRYTHCDDSSTSTFSAVGDLGAWLREVLIRRPAARPTANQAYVLLRERLALSVVWEGMN